jgi:hypothetical protein
MDKRDKVVIEKIEKYADEIAFIKRHGKSPCLFYCQKKFEK